LKFLAEKYLHRSFWLSRKATTTFDKPAINVKKLAWGLHTDVQNLRIMLKRGEGG